MGLEINTVRAQIGIDIQKPVQTLEQPKGEQQIEQIKAEMVLDWELPRVIIDQYQCFAEAGLKGNQDLFRDYGELGKTVVLEYTGRIALEGDQFGRIEDGRSAREVLAAISEENAWTELESNVDCIPKSRPEIDFSGHLNIDWKLGGARIAYRPNKPIHNYQPGKAVVYMKQWPSISIRYIDQRA
jgi:hypothetical protein